MMLRLESPGKGPCGNSKRSFIDVMKEANRMVDESKEYVKARVRWREMIHCGSP